MRLKVIACKVLTRELSYLAALSDNVIDFTWLRQGHHDRPEYLQKLLQETIDAIENNADDYTNPVVRTGEGAGVPDDYDAIVLGYGLCSNAVTGVWAHHHRIVIPKAHDCVTLFLGSKERYAACFRNTPGTFWYSAGWIDNTDMPGEGRTNRLTHYFEEEGYDEETISFLLEEMGGLKNYRAASFIRMPVFDRPLYSEATRRAAAYFGWDYHEFEGSMTLLEKLISGDWDEEDFLVLEPGETAVPSYDENVICRAKAPCF